MGGRGNAGSRNSSAEEKFTYQRSADIKEWSSAEENRTAEFSRLISSKLNEGGWNEFYEENVVEDLETVTIPEIGGKPAEEVSITKMNLIYTQNRDEDGRRVKQGKAVTGSTYYLVQTDNGSIDETHFAYKTKADAKHAMELYVDEEKQRREYYSKRR